MLSLMFTIDEDYDIRDYDDEDDDYDFDDEENPFMR